MPERETVIKALENARRRTLDAGIDRVIVPHEVLDSIIAMLKQEDAPQKRTEIIRCAECRKWDSKSGLTARMCAEWGRFTTQHEFCSRGAKWDA